MFEKGKIPKNTPRHIYKLNICDNRINNLKNNTSLEPDIDGNISVGPKVCNININDDGSNKTLYDEPGIPELMGLRVLQIGEITIVAILHSIHTELFMFQFLIRISYKICWRASR